MKHPFFKSFELSVLLILLLCGSLSPGAWAGEATDAGGRLGSGDGRIQVIPTLSAPSVKNGGKLTIQAVVKAQAGVAKVEAEIEGVTRLELKPAQQSGTGILPVMPGAPALVNVKNHGQDARATMNGLTLKNGMPAPGDTVALYQTEWTAQGLEEKVYPVTLRVTDLAGHVYEDHSLAFSDPAAGNSTVGRAAYPFGRAETSQELPLPGCEDKLACAVIDTAHGFMYVGAYTTPGSVVKVRLSDFTRVGTLILNSGEDYLQCAVIDPAKGYAYFGSGSSPGIVVKVRLADFTRVGALTLFDDPEDFAYGRGSTSAVIDPAQGYAYFCTDTSPVHIAKVRLSDFTRVAKMTLNSGEDAVSCAVIDPTHGYAYFGFRDASVAAGKIIKVRLSDFTRVGSLTLDAQAPRLKWALIDPAGGYAYFGADSNNQPGMVFKVRLADFTRTGTLTLNPDEKRLSCAVIDPAHGFACFEAGSQIIKIRLSDFARLGALPLNGFANAVIDPAGGYACFNRLQFSGMRQNASIKVRLSDLQQTGALRLSAGEYNLSSVVLDHVRGYAYFGTDTDPGTVVKVRLSDFTRVGSLTLKPEENNLGCGAIDSAGGYAYFGTKTLPGIIVKIRLSDFTRVGALKLNEGEGELRSAVIDPIGGHAYFGTDGYWLMSNISHIIKVRLADFTRTGTITLTGDYGLQQAAIDPAGGYAYFGAYRPWHGASASRARPAPGSSHAPFPPYPTPPPIPTPTPTPGPTKIGVLLKVRLSDFTHVGALTLKPGTTSNELISCLAIDPAGGHIYLGTNAGVIKVRLADFTSIATLDCGGVDTANVDSAGGYAYFSNSTRLIKVRLADFSQQEVIALPADTQKIACATLDPSGLFAYLGGSASKVLKVALDSSGRMQTLPLDGTSEDGIPAAVIDAQEGYAYLATSTVPVRIIKVRLSDFTRMATLTLKTGESYVTHAMIDPARGYACFVTWNNAAKRSIVVKVRLSDLTRAGTLTLNAEENVVSAAIDTAGGFAYFGTATHPEKAIKVRLSDLTRVGTLAFDIGEGAITCAVLDPVHGYGYFTIDGGFTPGVVIKVRLSDFTRAGVLTFNAKETHFSKAAIDPAGEYMICYAGTSSSSNLVKVRLSDFKTVGTCPLNPGENSLGSFAIDYIHGYYYYSTQLYADNQMVHKISRVRLSDMSQAGSLTIGPGDDNRVLSAMIDPAQGFAWFGTGARPGRLVKIRLSDFSKAGEFSLRPREYDLQSAAIDPLHGFAYFGTVSNPGIVVKVSLADFKRVGALHLKTGEDTVSSAVIDPAHGYGYFGTGSYPGNIIKVRLADFIRVGSLRLNRGEDYLSSAVIDPAGAHAWFGTNTSPGKVVKVRLADLTRVGALTLNAGETGLVSAVIDPAGAYAYFGADTQPGRIVKVRLANLTRVGALTLNAGEDKLYGAAIGPAGAYAYFGALTRPGIVVKVRLSDFTRVGTLRLPEGDDFLSCAVIDPAGQRLYCGTYTFPGRVVQVSLADFTRTGSLTLEDSALACRTAVVDPVNHNALFGAVLFYPEAHESGRVIKLELSRKGSLHANRVTLAERGALKDLRFYSHAAQGKLRLAIYSDGATKNLLWESGSITNNTTNGWVTAPVASGTPKTLTLTPGQYWLAWQTDSSAAVPSYAAGTAGEGFIVDQPYGLFPAKLGPDVTRSTSEKWSEYLTYDIPRNAALQWRMYP